MNNLGVTKFYQGIVLGSSLVSLLAGCEILPPTGNPASSGELSAGDVGCYSEKFIQPEKEILKSVDLLFVTDTSGSLDVERGAVANGIDSFVAELPLDADYQVAVMLAHGSRSNHSGRLWKHGNHPYVLNSKTMSLPEIRSHLHANLTNVSSDWHSDGGEVGLYSLQRGLDKGPLTSSRAHGFFREDAALAVVFISDENDICAKIPEGVTRVYDPDRLELSAFARDCKGVSPETVLEAVKTLQGDRPFFIGGILYNNLSTIKNNGENELGYGYLDLISLAHGWSVDMATNDYSQGLAEIGKLTSAKMQLLTEFTLAHGDIDQSTIAVSVDGVTSSFDYVSASNQVHVAQPGAARSVVEINYCVKQAPTPEPTPEPTVEPSPEPSCSGPGCEGGGVIGV